MKTLREHVMDELWTLANIYRDGSFPDVVVGIHPKASAEISVILLHAAISLENWDDPVYDEVLTEVEIDAREFNGDPNDVEHT